MKFEKKHFVYLLIGLLTSLLITALYRYTKIIDALELMSLDGMFNMRYTPPEQSQGINKRLNESIVIVGIDDAAHADFGRFPFPRSVYTKLLNNPLSSK